MKKEQRRVGIAEEKIRGIGRKKDEEGAEKGWDCRGEKAGDWEKEGLRRRRTGL